MILPEGIELRKAVLEAALQELIVAHLDPKGAAQSYAVFTAVNRKFDIRELEGQQKVLDAWSHLLRSGLLSLGWDIDRPNEPFFHCSWLGPYEIRDALSEGTKSLASRMVI